jgi:hypothetical protein
MTGSQTIIMTSERDTIDGLNSDEIIDRFSLLIHHFQSGIYIFLTVLELSINRQD